MRCLFRNKRTFYYALFKEKISIKDEYGNDSGEVRIIYEIPVEASANISAATGEAQVEQFGNSVTYDRVIIMDDLSIPIDENSVLCIDTPPSYDDEGNLIYDYIVKKVAKSLNTVSFAVSRVKVS